MSATQQLAKKMGMSTEELYDLIRNSEYTAECWDLKTNIGSLRLRILYNFYRELILDGKIPMSCISGIKILHTKEENTNFEISHILGVRESLIDLVKNLQLAVYPAGTGIEYGSTDNINGRLNLNDFVIRVNNINRRSFVKTYAFTSIENIVLMAKMSTNTGKTRMSANARLCTNDTYLPLTTNHGVGNYINIYALNGNVIRHFVDTDKLDFDAFKQYFIDYLLCGAKELEVKQINVEDIFNAMFTLIEPRYKKSWQQFTDNFYLTYDNDLFTLDHLKNIYAGKSKNESIMLMSSVKGVSFTSAEYFLNVYLEQYFRTAWNH